MKEAAADALVRQAVDATRRPLCRRDNRRLDGSSSERQRGWPSACSGALSKRHAAFPRFSDQHWSAGQVCLLSESKSRVLRPRVENLLLYLP